MEGKDGKHDTAATAPAAPAGAPPAAPAGAPQPTAPSAAGQPQPPEAVRWGTRQMGPPAAPGAHPENQEAARWTAARGDQELPPYVIMGEPVAAPAQQQRGKGDSPMEHILDFFNTWSRKAEELASNIWFNLKTAPSMSDAAMGKLSLGAKALSEGGFDKLYKQTFSSGPEEHLKKTFACYLSTATGPVAGTLYLTNMNVAFCSDRPLSFAAPSGQTAWSYYKVMIPLAKVAAVEPVTMKQNPPEKYVHVVTVDSHDFWFMGFVSYDKAVHHLTEAVSHRSQHGVAGATAAAGTK
ncbi:hypothetical protein SETIT_3G320700v2 [Setaria italica]|uniref:GRAM domain-containing protein n=1 Tax=Setaria italica TaxID=4555 RepID=K3Z8H0_SETIT|nr:GEM-like protein 5 [Setaria italica]RCV18668.1 hypothetical protein SETIT_3G320700v2 [Setaria italica]